MTTMSDIKRFNDETIRAAFSRYNSMWKTGNNIVELAVVWCVYIYIYI